MKTRRYRGRHLKARPRTRGPVVLGTAAAVWASAPSARAGVHVVAPGETLSEIAIRYGTTVEELAEANHLRDPQLIVAGKRLRVPGHVSVSSVHVVRPGDTLSSIAAAYGTSVASLARANRIRDVNLIFVGEELRVPAGGGVVATAAAPSVDRSQGGGSGASQDIEVVLEQKAAAHRVKSSLVKALAWRESGWRQEAVSESGAVGVMQVMPETARYVNKSLSGGNLDLKRAPDNVELGVTYLDHLLETMPSKDKALAAYLSGPGNVGRRLEGYQKDYVEDVKELEPRFGE
ncbi:MAG TPA: LysM peptidoglycan-binding domain-containing protein [Actinomycetota bacterium]|nr:LysM peptidoglycan-binding domain-containing protein [Actinomycetota bacterium]